MGKNHWNKDGPIECRHLHVWPTTSRNSNGNPSNANIFMSYLNKNYWPGQQLDPRYGSTSLPGNTVKNYCRFYSNKQTPSNQTSGLLTTFTSIERVAFLDTSVILMEDYPTVIYTKPNKTHQYISSESFHPRHCATLISYIARVIGFDESAPGKAEPKAHLLARRYQERAVNHQIKKAATLLAMRHFSPTNQDYHRTPLVVTYQPNLVNLTHQIHHSTVHHWWSLTNQTWSLSPTKTIINRTPLVVTYQPNLVNLTHQNHHQQDTTGGHLPTKPGHSHPPKPSSTGHHWWSLTNQTWPLSPTKTIINRTPLVVTYQPNLANLTHQIHHSTGHHWWSLINQTWPIKDYKATHISFPHLFQTQTAIPNSPLLAFRRPRIWGISFSEQSSLQHLHPQVLEILHVDRGATNVVKKL